LDGEVAVDIRCRRFLMTGNLERCFSGVVSLPLYTIYSRVLEVKR
jgi:hypothetical protein